jgi:hypothetical protein
MAEIQSSGDFLDGHRFPFSRTKIVKIGNGYFGKSNQVAIRDAQSFLGFEKDVEMCVFEVHGRRRVV